MKGKFPISFTIWNTAIKEAIQQINCDIYVKKKEKVGVKSFYGDLPQSINQWIVKYQIQENEAIGILSNYPPDFQNQNKVFIQYKPSARSGAIKIHSKNLIPVSVYFAVRHCIKANWMNDRNQFLYPNDGWLTDTEFQNDCLAFTLFHGQNRISCKDGINHWIPFSEQEVNAREKFDSNFMYNFLKGKSIKPKGPNFNSFILFEPEVPYHPSSPLVFSDEAKDVFAAGLDLWKYYHAQPKVQVNAALYDIKAYFQGQDNQGRMQPKSKDEIYNSLLDQLREALQELAEKLESKLYTYRFLRV